MNPVEVDGDRLTIVERSMTMFAVYRFKFLDTDMVAVRTPNGVEVFEELQYLDDKDEIERGPVRGEGSVAWVRKLSEFEDGIKELEVE